MRIKLFIFLQYLLPKKLISRLVAYLADSEISWLKNNLISAFAKYYQVDLSEAEYQDIELYANFNDFFTRQLKEGVRVVDPRPEIICSPCDGAISQLGNIDYQNIVQAKGHYYTLQELLADDETLAKTFSDGHFATIYLAPKDYHRVHMPLDGRLVKTTYVPGELFSVNRDTAENIPRLFARNERLICEFDTAIGPVVSIMVGAVIVAGIETAWSGQIAPPPSTPSTTHFKQPQQVILKKGDEMGRFKLGSTVILLFPKNSIDFNKNLQHGSTLVMGQNIAQSLNDNNA